MSGVPPIDVFGLTDTGRKRPHNEDQFLIARLTKALDLIQTSLDESSLSVSAPACAAELFVVADGVGGQDAGELASSLAVETLATQIHRAASCFYGFDVDSEHEFIEGLERAMGEAHRRIAGLEGGARRPATTLTMLTLLWPRGYVFHVGDSRGYYLRNGRLQQFTRDHTLAEQMVDAGLVSEEVAARRGMQHVLSRAMGGQDATPSIGVLDFRAGDVLLLCSDGLTLHVADHRIGEILAESGSAEAACRTLLEEALAGGGLDNVTVIVARMGAEPAGA